MKNIILFILLPISLISQSNYNLSLLGTYDNYSSEGTDIWGWVAPDGSEYALVGLNDGFSVVNVTNPSNPIEEFYINDVSSTWRDIKTWGNYAYITTDANNPGLLIVDLSDMTGNTYFYRTIFNNSNGSSTEFTNAHNIYIDENGVAYIFGASSNTVVNPTDGVIFLDVDTDPLNPIYLGEWNDFYVHDGMVRGDTMYVGCVYEGDLYVVDVSNKSNPQNLGNIGTPNDFTHNAWVSDNGNYVFTTDEKSDAYIGSYDISDLNNIQEVDRIQSNAGSNSIPHNVHVDGNFLITSYYRDGTVVHDITHPNNLIQVASFDSSPLSGDGFDGCWGTYPYLPSGNIISSDINSGSGNNGRLLVYSRDFQQACYLEGNVTDLSNSIALTNVTIEIINPLTTISSSTDLSGNYFSGIVYQGTYDIIFSSPGYLTDTISAILTNGNTTVINAQLQPLVSFNTSGMVIDINGNGIPNADILIYNNSFTYNSTSDNSGNFSISGIYEGNYDVIAGAWGFVTSCTNEFISSSST
ncbi:MAG: choice-of-anchor B family protein, partial [Flavobacteriales bacterium]